MSNSYQMFTEALWKMITAQVSLTHLKYDSSIIIKIF